MDMQVSFAGLELDNPIMTASGTFGYGTEYTPYGALENLGAIVVKGISLKPRQGNPQPRISETACGMLNAIGLQNIGVEAFLRDKLPQLPWRTTPVLVNLYGQSVEEFAELTDRLATAQGIGGVELNISCPNVREGGVQFGQDPAQAARVTAAVKKRAGKLPVMVKLSPNVTDITVMARAVADAGANCISLINTLTGMAVDIHSRRPKLANVVGGLSGPAIKPVALRMVYQVTRSVDIPVVGLGGIASAQDVLEFLLVGAHAVQVGTANFMRPDTAFTLVEDLQALSEHLGLTNWEDYRGSLKVP